MSIHDLVEFEYMVLWAAFILSMLAFAVSVCVISSRGGAK